MTNIISRVEAKSRGLKRYFTGKPCKNGHTSERAVCNFGCVECQLEADKRFYEANTERMRARSRKYHATNRETILKSNRRRRAENTETIRERDRRYTAMHREERRAIAKKHRDQNLDEVNKRTREWRKANREKRAEAKRKLRATEAGRLAHLADQHRRHARKKQVPGDHTAADIKRLLDNDKFCHVCGKPFTKRNPPTIDHVIALADPLGLGTNDPGNLALAHAKCNFEKQNFRFNPLTGQGQLL